VIDYYGTGETGVVCSEGPDQDGMYIWEDAHFVEIIDAEGVAPVPDGQIGTICVTCLFKDDVFPVIRYNTKDLSALMEDPAGTGWTLRRLRGFLGRSDNMIKLRGINVYPTAIGELVKMISGTNGEFICRVIRDGSRDDMIVAVESSHPSRELEASLKDLLRKRIGVDFVVEVVPAGSLAAETEMESRQKPIRLRDLRKR
jgi:phenylacetate-CoA ligase